MHGGELSPIKWDAAKRHMTPLVRSWPGVLEADPVMQQNMTLLSSFFLLFFFLFCELAAAALFLVDGKRGCHRCSDEKLGPAAPSASTLLTFPRPICFLQLCFPSLSPLFSPSIRLISLSSHTLVSFLSTSLLLSTHAFFPSFVFLAPTHSSSYTCTPCSVLSNSSHTLLFVLSPLPAPSLFSHFTSGSSWVSGQVF